MQLRPLKELIAMSKEKLDEAMAPIRAKQIRSQAELEMAKLEAEILTKQTSLQEAFIKKDHSINFPDVMDKLDDIELLERRQRKYEEMLGHLFPTKAA